MSLPPRCVADTCAVEYLRVGELLRPFLASTTALIPDLLQDEMSGPVWSQVQTWGAQVTELTNDEVREVIRLSHERRALSPHDFATIVVAKREGVPLVTSNFAHLPAEAQKHGVGVFGVLRVVQELVAIATIDPLAAARGLTAMLGADCYLPEEECKRLIARLAAMGR